MGSYMTELKKNSFSLLQDASAAFQTLHVCGEEVGEGARVSEDPQAFRFTQYSGLNLRAHPRPYQLALLVWIGSSHVL